MPRTTLADLLADDGALLYDVVGLVLRKEDGGTYDLDDTNVRTALRAVRRFPWTPQQLSRSRLLAKPYRSRNDSQSGGSTKAWGVTLARRALDALHRVGVVSFCGRDQGWLLHGFLKSRTDALWRKLGARDPPGFHYSLQGRCCCPATQI